MNARTLLMIVSLALSVLIGLVLARGRPGEGLTAGGGSRTGPVLVGLSLDTLKEERWQADSKLFQKRCKELGADVLVQSANGDDSRQIQDCQALLSQHVGVLVIVPHDGVTMAQAVEMAHRDGVPVIAYDRLIKNSDLDLYMSFDNERVGAMQAQYLVDHLPTPGKGKIVRIYGASTDNNAKLFKAGQDKVLKPFIDRGDIQVLHEDWAADWKPENGKRIMGAAITKLGKNFDAVLASNDGTAGGAIQQLMEDGLAGKVLVTGQDAELPACQRIAGGSQSMTIYKPLNKLAAAAAEAAVKLAKGKPLVATQLVNNGQIDVPSILNDVVTVSRDNLAATVIKEGFQKYDDVYSGIPENQRPPRP